MGSYLWSAANDKLEVYFQPRFRFASDWTTFSPGPYIPVMIVLSSLPLSTVCLLPRVPALLATDMAKRYALHSRLDSIALHLLQPLSSFSEFTSTTARTR